MYRRILALFIAIVSVITPFPVMAADADILIYETFDDYALNSLPEGVNIKGLDARVVQRKDNDKAIYSKLWGTGMQMDIPLNGTRDRIVFSFDMMAKGDKFTGNAIDINSNSQLLNFMHTGAIALEDGYEIGGIRNNKWTNYTAIIDFANKKYDLYIDGARKAKNRLFSQSVTTPKRFYISLSALTPDSLSEVYIDNIKIYSGNEILPQSAFPNKKTNYDTVEFIATTEKPSYDKVYVNSSGEEGLNGGFFSSKEETWAGWSSPDEEKDNAVCLKQEGKLDVYADFTTGVDEVMAYVWQADIYNSVRTSECTLFLAQDTDHYSRVLTTRGGNLYSSGILVGALPYDTWTNIAVVVDNIGGTGDVYINGELKLARNKLENGSTNPKKMRMQITTTTTPGNNAIYFKNVRVYEGQSLRNFENQSVDNEGKYMTGRQYKTIQDTKKKAQEMLEEDVAFMTNCDWYFADGEKHRYSDLGIAAYSDENGVSMVPASLLSKVLGTEITIKGGTVNVGGKTAQVGSAETDYGKLAAAPTEKDGTVYLPAASFAKVMLSKYAYEDERGFVLISDINRNYSNSPIVKENLEDIDILYRYLQYERPDGEQIYNDMMAYSHGEYPRTFISKKELPDLRKRISENDDLKAGLARLLASCEAYFTADLVKYEIYDGLRLFLRAHEVSVRLRNMGVAYLITEDEKYAQRMWAEMENAISWPDWNVNQHFLDSGRMAPGVAFAYDVLHDYLTEEQKKYFREQVDKLFLDAAVNCYEGSLYCNALDYRLTGHNWGAVCGSGMLMMALVLMDEEPGGSPLNEKCKFIAENALQTLEYSLGNYFPDGPTGEGVQYWSFYMEHLGFSIESLVNICGSDYSLLATPGYKSSSDYAIHIQTTEGWYNHSSTEGFGPFWEDSVFLEAAFFDDNARMELYNSYRKLLGMQLSAQGLLWYEPSDTVVDINKEPLDRRFRGEDILTMHGSWTDEAAAYLGIRGGLQERGHFDKGTFIYDLGGERWFVDLGNEDYNIEGGYTPGFGGDTLYRIRLESHNGLVINPSATDGGMLIGKSAVVERFESKPKGAISVLDLTSLYGDKVTDYKRGFYMGDERETLIVQDEVKMIEPDNEFYYSLHTKGDIAISQDGKSATITQNGKTLKIEFICDAKNYKLTFGPETNTFPENDRNGERSRDEYRKLVMTGTMGQSLNISAKFSLVGENEYPSLQFENIASWQIPDGEITDKPKIDAIYMNGTPIENFNESFRDFTVTVTSDMKPPVFSADSSNSTVTITQPEALHDTVILVAQNEAGKKARYTVKLNEVPKVVDGITAKETVVGLPSDVNLAEVKSAIASHIPQPENPPEHVFDENFDTRWAADTMGAWVEVDIGEVKDLLGIAVAYAWGEGRKYAFDLLVSEDKKTFTRVYSGRTKGGTNGYEYVQAPIKARYVRLIGYGHTTGEWNSVTELRPCVLK